MKIFPQGFLNQRKVWANGARKTRVPRFWGAWEVLLNLLPPKRALCHLPLSRNLPRMGLSSFFSCKQPRPAQLKDSKDTVCLTKWVEKLGSHAWGFNSLGHSETAGFWGMNNMFVLKWDWQLISDWIIKLFPIKLFPRFWNEEAAVILEICWKLEIVNKLFIIKAHRVIFCKGSIIF